MITTMIVLTYLALALAIHSTMEFLVSLANSVVDGIKEGQAYIDNRQFIVSWVVFILCLIAKEATLTNLIN